MILIGMFDSPFVRRVAVSLNVLGIPFEHRDWSVGKDLDRIREFNPLGRVPTSHDAPRRAPRASTCAAFSAFRSSSTSSICCRLGRAQKSNFRSPKSALAVLKKTCFASYMNNRQNQCFTAADSKDPGEYGVFLLGIIAAKSSAPRCRSHPAPRLPIRRLGIGGH